MTGRLSFARLTVFLTVVVMGIIGLNVARYVLHEEGRLPLRGTVQSPFGSSPAVSPAPPLQSLSQGEE